MGLANKIKFHFRLTRFQGKQFSFLPRMLSATSCTCSPSPLSITVLIAEKYTWRTIQIKVCRRRSPWDPTTRLKKGSCDKNIFCCPNSGKTAFLLPVIVGAIYFLTDENICACFCRDQTHAGTQCKSARTPFHDPEQNTVGILFFWFINYKS